MSDPDIQREIEANLQRDRAGEIQEDDDGPIIDSAERVLDPLVEPFAPDANDGDDETLLDPEEARRNDEAQRPD